MRTTDSSVKAIVTRPYLIICELFPYPCARLPHCRFLLSSDSLPSVSYGDNFTLAEGPLDQYRVKHDDVVDSILSMLDGEPQTTIGLSNIPIRTSKFVHYLQEVWQASAVHFATASANIYNATEEAVDAEEEIDAEKMSDM